MKKLFKPTLLIVLMSLALASPSNASSEKPGKPNNIEKTSEEEVQRMINRLEEIKSMDASTMTRKEKRVLRHEVKSINHSLQTQSSGVYVSVGALIIIILLLIILL